MLSRSLPALALESRSCKLIIALEKLVSRRVFLLLFGASTNAFVCAMESVSDYRSPSRAKERVASRNDVGMEIM